ncbi:hypothetical protein INR49_020292 [Caranx melampygus]|nr:hypothetical protein INR49_020292 [Caranx melampygus]
MSNESAWKVVDSREKSRPPLPPLNPPLKPGGAPRGGPKEPLLAGLPRPPRGPMKPRPRKPPLPRLCLRGMPNVGLRSLTNAKTNQDPAFQVQVELWQLMVGPALLAPVWDFLLKSPAEDYPQHPDANI